MTEATEPKKKTRTREGVTINFGIPTELHYRMKTQALKERKLLYDIVVQAFEEYLEHHEKERKQS